MKLHRQQLRARVNQVCRPQDRLRVAPRPVQAVAQHRLRVDPRRRMSTWEQQKVLQTADEFRGSDVGDDASAKCQRFMAGMPILHETDVDVDVDAHEMVVLAAMPDGQGEWTQRFIDWDKKYYGAKSGTLFDTQKVYDSRLSLRLLRSWRWRVPLQQARAQSLEIVCGKWLDDAKGTPEDPDAVRSRLVATQVNTYVCEDVTQRRHHQSKRPESL